MSVLWFTADLHFGHANIARFCNRPYIRPGELEGDAWSSEAAREAVERRMNEDLVNRWNARVKPGDTVVHVGDFCNRGNNRGVPGSRMSSQHWEARLNGKIVFVRGNHDRNNGLKFAFDSLIATVGGMKVFIRHKPLEPFEDMSLPAGVAFAVCGHVHEKWVTRWLDGVLSVNVGVDAHGLYPVSQSELIGLYMRERRAGEAKEREGLNVTSGE